MNGALYARRIVNTRAAHQADGLSAGLRAQGAIPVEWPCIAIAPPDDPAPFDAALRELCAGGFDWLILTSANTVYAIAERLTAGGLAFDPPRFQTAAVGTATAAAARDQLGMHAAALADTFTGDALADALTAVIAAAPGIGRALLPESALARDAHGTSPLARRLDAVGLAVRAVEAYRTICAPVPDGDDLAARLRGAQIDALTFTSPSTVRCFLERLTADARESAFGCPAACIGTTTAAAARTAGFRRVLVSNPHTVEGLIAALKAHFESVLFNKGLV
ncbi:MAG: uroporphyrinogen-III synthase [bacterium]|nr:uroporphyrinogen-III synthase [bacterium]